MLPTRTSLSKAVRNLAGIAAIATLAACAPRGPVQVSSDSIDVDPFQTVPVALLVPTGSGDPGREELGRSLINAAQLAAGDLQNAEIDLRVYPTGGTTEGGASAASQAVNDGAKIIVGPLFSTATTGAESVARGAGVKILSMSNNTEVASPNVYLLGNTFENTADSLVSYGMSQASRITASSIRTASRARPRAMPPPRRSSAGARRSSLRNPTGSRSIRSAPRLCPSPAISARAGPMP